MDLSRDYAKIQRLDLQRLNLESRQILVEGNTIHLVQKKTIFEQRKQVLSVMDDVVKKGS